jgi:hypothetical protein
MPFDDFDDFVKAQTKPTPTPAVSSAPDDFDSFLNTEKSMADAMKRGADALQIDPEDYATAISYESARTFDPWAKGPTTKWGQHRGTIQYGEPQRKTYGVHKGQTFDDQVTNSNVRYLKDKGVKPGMTFAQIYAAINGGNVNKNLNTPDADTGRTIADNISIAEKEHRAEVRKRFGQYFNSGPAQTVTPFQSRIAANGAAQIPAPPIEDIAAFNAAFPATPVPEAPATKAAQAQAAADPEKPRNAVLLDAGEFPNVNDPRWTGFGAFTSKDGRSIMVNLAGAKKLGLKDAAHIQNYLDKNDGALPKLLGKAYDAGNSTGGNQPTTVTRAPDGTELTASITPTVKDQAKQFALDQANHPGANTSVVGGDDVALDRIKTLGGLEVTPEPAAPTMPPMTQAGELMYGDPRTAQQRGQPLQPDMPEAPPVVATDADFQAANEYLKSRNQPLLSREQFDAAQTTVGKSAQATGYQTKPQEPKVMSRVAQRRAQRQQAQAEKQGVAAQRSAPQWKTSDQPLNDEQLMGTTIGYDVDFPEGFKGDKTAAATAQVRSGLKRDFGLTDEQAKVAVGGELEEGPLTEGNAFRLHVSRAQLAKVLGKEKVKADYDAERAQPTMDLAQQTDAQNAQRGGYQVATDMPALKPTGDPLRNQATANISADPFSAGTDEAIQKEYERLQRTTPDAEERAALETAGKYFGKFDMTGTNTGLVQGASWLADIAAGAWKLSPIGLMEYAVKGYSPGGEMLGKLANRGRLIAKGSRTTISFYLNSAARGRSGSQKNPYRSERTSSEKH